MGNEQQKRVNLRPEPDGSRSREGAWLCRKRSFLSPLDNDDVHRDAKSARAAPHSLKAVSIETA